MSGKPRYRWSSTSAAVQGVFSELLAAHFGVQVIGIDPSQKMLDQARCKPAAGNVVYRQAAAEALSLPDSCADLVFMSMVYRHLTDPAAVAILPTRPPSLGNAIAYCARAVTCASATAHESRIFRTDISSRHCRH